MATLKREIERERARERERENMRMDMNMNVFGILWGCLVWFSLVRTQNYTHALFSFVVFQTFFFWFG